MKTKTRNISLPPELDAFIQNRVRSGQYGNASDVIRAGLRSLAKDEMVASYAEWQKIMSELPQDPITPEIEQSVVKHVNEIRAQRRAKLAKAAR
jgi:putative addiction module CopG family antidote